MVKYKMMLNGKEYDGVWSVDECGENVKVALNDMPDYYNPNFTFVKVEDDGSPYVVKSTKKSQSQPTSFSDMVKKQRAINKGESFYPDGDNGPRMDPLFDGYYTLGNEEQMALEDVCKDLGMTGFKEFVDRAIMLFYEKGRTHQD